MDDLISRQAAIDALNEVVKDHSITDFDAIASILDLPPAQPQRIKGHWIEHNDGLTACECSVCHEKYALYEEYVFGRNFCPNCGADMREVTT